MYARFMALMEEALRFELAPTCVLNVSIFTVKMHYPSREHR